jgi:hypothetical protein
MACRRGGRILAALLASVVLGACNSSNTAGTGPNNLPPKGPATAQITLGGDPALAAALTQNVNIACNALSFNGTEISVSTKAGAPIFVAVTIRGGYIQVRAVAGTGNGPFFRRTWTGTGTSGFNAAKGVHLSGSLTEITPAGTNKGTIGALTSVSGTVDCGNQKTGTSTIRLTGDSKFGPVDGTLSPVRVGCVIGNSFIFVGISGFMTIDGKKTLVHISLDKKSIQVTLIQRGGVDHIYIVRGAAAQIGVTVNSTGGRVDGDVSEQGAPAATALKIHAKGDASCGVIATY